MVNKLLIVEECRRQGINVTRHEVDAEIERMAKRFNIPVDQWLKMLKQERNVTPDAICQRHHLADARAAEAGGRAAQRQPGRVSQGIRDAIWRGGAASG